MKKRILAKRKLCLKNLSHLSQINIGGNYARKQQKCETVISDGMGLAGGEKGNAYVMSREC